MEHFNNNGEQPDCDVQTVATGVELGTIVSQGSPIGKFKDANKLLDAYNELQSEFTRKCQKLSDAEKKLQNLDIIDNAGDHNIKINEFAWNKNIKEFLQSHKNANNFVNEITQELINNENFKNSENGLEQAYYKVLDDNFISKQDMANDDKFLKDFIYNNKTIKEKIINEYISSLEENKNPLKLANSGFNRGVSFNTQIDNLEEAKKYVENMFKF